MAAKQLKAKYTGSILGISWAIINPLLIMLAITFVFAIVFETQIKNFPLFVLSGIFPWMFFSNALSDATNSILGQQSILRQFSLPREILPLSSVLSNFLNFLIGWIVIYPIFLFNNPKIIYTTAPLVIIILLHLFFIVGLSLILSVTNVFFRDIGQLLGVLLMFWFWVTPIFYSLDMVPAKFLWVCSINPMTYYMISYQEAIFNVKMPSSLIFGRLFIFSFISLVIGLWIFSRLESKLLKKI